MSTLTDEQLNRAVCEWLGWKFWLKTRDTCIGFTMPVLGDAKPWLSTRPQDENDWRQVEMSEVDWEKLFRRLPSHIAGPEALGNMHEAEKSLENWQWSEHTTALRKIIQTECNKPECYVPGTERAQLIADFWFYHATSLQRATALLRVVKPELFQ